MVSFLKRHYYHQNERLHRAASSAITGCLSSSHIPLFLFEASLPPLRVTLTHFALSFYEQGLRLSTFIPISCLASLGVKLRLCRSSWRAFRSTHPLKLSSTSPREALLTYPPCPPRNLPFFTEESTFPLHAPALIPLPFAKVQCSLTLTLSHIEKHRQRIEAESMTTVQWRHSACSHRPVLQIF